MSVKAAVIGEITVLTKDSGLESLELTQLAVFGEDRVLYEIHQLSLLICQSLHSAGRDNRASNGVSSGKGEVP